MVQTEVLSGDGWNLGEDSGQLSADGKKISGTGKDPLGESLGITYEWAFTKKAADAQKKWMRSFGVFPGHPRRL